MIEVRTCVKCGNPYTIDNYEKANPMVRDLCLPCIEEEFEKRQEAATDV